MSTETTAVLVRMRDVGLALDASLLYARALSRIQLQKYLYLMDSVAVLYKLLPPVNAHYTFRHGPYDPYIQGAVDALAFRGLASIKSLARRSNGNIASEYTLSDAGKRWAQGLRENELFAERGQLAHVVGYQVDRLGWDRLVPLVYAEPTFLSSRPDGYGMKLKPQRSSTNSSAYVLQLIQHALPSGSLVNRQIIVEYYFDFLEAYSRAQPVASLKDSF
jgi:hypothetical protein